MTCCYNEKHETPATKVVPYKDRSCTDILFLALYIAGWVAIIILFAEAVKAGGDPNRIIRPIQYNGTICGVDTLSSSDKYGLFPETYTSTDVLLYCVPDGTTTSNTTLSNVLADDVAAAMGDMYTAWPVILAAAGIALILSFVYTWLTKYIAGFLVWIAIILILVGGFLTSYSLLKQYHDSSSQSQFTTRSKTVLGLGIAVSICTVLFLLLVFCLRDRIAIAIGVVKEAGAALVDIPGIIVFPVFPFLLGCAFLLWFIFVSLYIFSVGSFETAPIGDLQPLIASKINNSMNYTYFSWNSSYKSSFSANFFHLLWNIQFMVYFTFMVIAGAVAAWYFTPFTNPSGGYSKPRNSKDGSLSNHPLLDSLLIVLRYHLGSIAFAAAIVAVVEFVRWFLRYIEKHTKGVENKCKKCMFCLVDCCLGCLECCLDKVNKNALIWESIWGDSFCTSACSAFVLLFRNIARTAALNLIGAYLMIMGKIFVALITTGICAIALISVDPYKSEMSSIAMPCFVIFVGSYMVAQLFMGAFETAIDTTFLCFLVDEEYNKGHMFAHHDLISVVDKHEQQSKQAAAAIIENSRSDDLKKKYHPNAVAPKS